MASRLPAKEERAEAAAREAADELSEVNKDTRERENMADDDQTQGRQEERSPGVIGSIIRTVQDTVGHAKEAVVGKSHETAEKAAEAKDSAAEKAKQAKDTRAEKTKETLNSASEKAKQGKDATAGKIGEYKDYSMEKAKETKDATLGKAGEYKEKAKETKDSTVEKAGEYKDYSAEKAKEGKDTTVGKISELKDSAAGAARKAMDYLTWKKDETKEKAEETKEAAKETYHGAKEETRRKMEEMKIEGEDARSDAPAAGREHEGKGGGGGGILGALGSVKDAIVDKLTPHTTDTAKDKDTRVSYGAEGEPKTGRRLAVDEDGIPVVVAQVTEVLEDLPVVTKLDLVEEETPNCD